MNTTTTKIAGEAMTEAVNSGQTDREALLDSLAATVQRRIDACCVAANTPGADYFDASTNLIIAARDLLSALAAQSPAPASPSGEDAAEQAVASMVEPMILKGTGKINGDGWKDTTKIGEVVFVWNAELPRPYEPGQYPRMGNQCGWTASTRQYDFTPATLSEARSAIEGMLAIPQHPAQPVAQILALTDEQILEIAREYQTVVPGNCLYILEFARDVIAKVCRQIGYTAPSSTSGDDSEAHESSGAHFMFGCGDFDYPQSVAAQSAAPASPSGEDAAEEAAAPVADPLRAAVESMVCMLENGEWAEHASTYRAPGDKLAARLEAAITNLHNELSGDSDEAVTLPIMRAAFRVTETEGDSDQNKQRFHMRFTFRSMEELHAADDQWRAFQDAARAKDSE